MMNKLRGALRSATMWVNGLFLAAYPFAGDIVLAVRENLPGLAEYLPANIYQAVGLAVVIFNIYQRTRTKESLAEKGAP
jgi:hypothetical protein